MRRQPAVKPRLKGPRPAMVVAADGAFARLFLASAAHDARQPIDDRANPSAHHQDSEWVCAADVCKRVADRIQETHSEGLYAVAEAGFLGLLRQRRDTQRQRKVTGEVNKSLTRHTPQQIRASLPEPL